jgi:hypothetical protein
MNYELSQNRGLGAFFNLPGRILDVCLRHDIVAREDAIRLVAGNLPSGLSAQKSKYRW